MKKIKQYSHQFLEMIFVVAGIFILAYAVFRVDLCDGLCFPNLTISIILFGFSLIAASFFLARRRISKMVSIKRYRLLLSLLLGLLTTIITALFRLPQGDFILSGLPIPYYNAIWGEGYEWEITLFLFVIDILLWSFVWFIIFSIITRRIDKRKRGLK